jgi:hypothetical protein
MKPLSVGLTLTGLLALMQSATELKPSAALIAAVILITLSRLFVGQKYRPFSRSLSASFP